VPPRFAYSLQDTVSWRDCNLFIPVRVCTAIVRMNCNVVYALVMLLPLQSSCHISTIYFPVSAVIKQLKKLKISNTITPDTFYSNTLKIFRLSIAKPLSIFIEFMFSRNYIPPEWKLAFIIPTHKKGSRSDPNNYRPITNTSIICRIMERIIHAQLTNHLVTNNFLCSSQQGFQAGRSAVSNLLECSTDWLLEINSGNNLDVVYLDLSKV